MGYSFDERLTPCSRCGADDFEKCRRKSGTVLDHPHPERSEAAVKWRENVKILDELIFGVSVKR